LGGGRLSDDQGKECRKQEKEFHGVAFGDGPCWESSSQARGSFVEVFK
jgi:hypothetical protein